MTCWACWACSGACSAFVFLAVILLAISQLLGEENEKYSVTPYDYNGTCEVQKDGSCRAGPDQTNLGKCGSGNDSDFNTPQCPETCAPSIVVERQLSYAVLP